MFFYTHCCWCGIVVPAHSSSLRKPLVRGDVRQDRWKTLGRSENCVHLPRLSRPQVGVVSPQDFAVPVNPQDSGSGRGLCAAVPSVSSLNEIPALAATAVRPSISCRVSLVCADAAMRFCGCPCAPRAVSVTLAPRAQEISSAPALVGFFCTRS